MAMLGPCVVVSHRRVNKRQTMGSTQLFKSKLQKGKKKIKKKKIVLMFVVLFFNKNIISILFI